MPGNVAVDHRTLQSFFYFELGDAQARTGASLPPEVGAYVVDLLSRYARRPGEAGRTAEPLVLQYLSARQTSGSSRSQALRSVGDRALYIAGVVPQSLHRGAVRVGYVRSIGEAAYRDLACPEDAVQYSLAHFTLPKSVRENISTQRYESGHMMYLFRPDAEKLRRDLVEWIKPAAK